MTDPHPTKPRLQFVTRKWPPAIGGMETYSVHLVEHLGHRFDVDVIACAGQEDGSAPTAKSLLAFGLKSFRRLMRLSPPPDVLHIGDMASWPLALPAKLRRWSSTIAISAHGTDVSFARRGGIKGNAYGAYLRMGQRLLSKATVIANSHATADAVRDFGWTRVAIVPLASDLRGANPAPHPTKALLFAGRILPLKGLRWFVEHVLPTLPDDITLNVAGTIWDAREAECLSEPRVTYLGPLPQDQLTREYQRALAVIIPNIEMTNGTFEGYGLVATEASACGAVTLAAAAGGLEDAILDTETGFLLPPGDAAAWSEKIVGISEWTDEKRHAFVANSMRKCHAYFTWDRVTQETCAAYETR